MQDNKVYCMGVAKKYEKIIGMEIEQWTEEVHTWKVN